MPQSVDREDVRQLVEDSDAILAEVLPRAEYEWAHLEGAIHLPLKGWDIDEVERRLDRDRPVVVYCNDHQCDMSPRAAWRLEMLGFDAHDYVAGKQDWLAFGLPHEGFADLTGDHLTTDVATCSVDARVGDVRGRLDDIRFGMVVVLNAEGVVLGRLDAGVVEADGGTAVDTLMREGPTTVRPSEDLDALIERMQGADVDAVLVTRSDGTLLGLLERDTAETALKDAHETGEGAHDADR